MYERLHAIINDFGVLHYIALNCRFHFCFRSTNVQSCELAFQQLTQVLFHFAVSVHQRLVTYCLTFVAVYEHFNICEDSSVIRSIFRDTCKRFQPNIHFVLFPVYQEVYKMPMHDVWIHPDHNYAVGQVKYHVADQQAMCFAYCAAFSSLLSSKDSYLCHIIYTNSGVYVASTTIRSPPGMSDMKVFII